MHQPKEHKGFTPSFLEGLGLNVFERCRWEKSLGKQWRSKTGHFRAIASKAKILPKGAIYGNDL
jgi:hypothetical protein